MNPIRRFVLLGAAAALLGCTTAPPAVAPELRSALAPTGTLRIGVYPGSPTSLVRGPGADEQRGLTVELGREMARRLGVPAQVVVFERVPQIVDAIKAGQVDMTVTNASPARAREIDFSPTVVRLETGYLVPAASRITTLAQVDVAGVRVGVSQGSTSQGVLTRELKAAQLVAAPSVVAAGAMLGRGELDAFATNKGILFEMADKLPGARVLDGRWGLEQLAIGVPKGREAGAAWLKAFAADPATQALVQQAAQRAGLRGLASDAP
jgi:polar amino acid transport system substrate-binding protein